MKTIEHLFPTAIEQFFANPLTAKQEAYVTKHYERVRARVTQRIHGKYKLPYATAEDIALSAIMYALIGVFTRNEEVPSSEKQLLAAALWKANNLAKDEMRARAKALDLLLVDNPFVNAEGESSGENPILAKGGEKRWTDQKFEERWNELLDQTGPALRRFLDENFSRRTAAIFWARVMDRLSMPETCRAFKTNENCVSVTCHRVMQEWKARGKDYYADVA